MLYIVGALLLIFLAVVFFVRGSQQQQEQGLPTGRVVYDDSSQRGREEIRPIYSRRLGLTGKPDYIVRHHHKPIPVEVKSRRAPRQPYDSHIFQLAAYCLLVEEKYGQRPEYGIIRYSDRSFEVDFTSELEKQLLIMLEEMRQHNKTHAQHRSHEDANRCAGCGYRDICQERLK